MVIAPQILFGDVMHARTKPRRNAFRYGIYYIACPLTAVPQMQKVRRFGLERFAPLSFYKKDHGDRQGGNLEEWMRAILRDHDVPQADGEIVLVTMPRVLGYVFNPVSFWLCHDRAGALIAVLCEVNNTFGESHNYLCVHGDRRPIAPEDWLVGEKFFHVSPFIELEGSYRFRFIEGQGELDFVINHYDAMGELLLTTRLWGDLAPFTTANLRRAFWRYPLVTIKAVALIHWQAIKLLAKGVRYVPKPPQKPEKLTRTGNITKV